MKSEIWPVINHEETILNPGSLNVPNEHDAHTWLRESIDNNVDHYLIKFHNIRGLFVKYFGFAIPNIEAINTIKKYSPYGVTEIGAGLGYWTYLLNQNGIPTIGVDQCPPGSNKYFTDSQKSQPGNFWTDIIVKDAEDYLQYDESNKTLLMIWPDKYVDKALAAYKGETIIMIGEGYEGCTDTGGLFNQELQKWAIVEKIYIPTFYGINDFLTVFKKEIL